jgi:hypothetical protein
MCVFSRFARAASCVALIGVCLLWTAAVRALDLLGGDFQLHGFASLTLVNTTDNNFFGRSDDRVSRDFTEVGANASWRLTSDVQLAAELLSHRAGGTDDGGVRLDYGLIDWTPLSREDGRAGIRLGRIKTAYGLYNKTRDVPFTRPSIILPQSIYFERTRNLTVSADGGEIYAERYGDAGSLFASFAYGQPQTDTDAAKVALVGLQRPGSLDSSLAPDFQVFYEGSGGMYRLGLTATRLDLRYKPGFGDRLLAGRFKLTPLILFCPVQRRELEPDQRIRFAPHFGFGLSVPFSTTAPADGRAIICRGPTAGTTAGRPCCVTTPITPTTRIVTARISLPPPGMPGSPALPRTGRLGFVST